MNGAKYIKFLLLIIFLFIILLLPFALYGLLQQPWNFNAIGGEDAPKIWLNFWGSYLGTIISSLTAFIVLFITYKQNQKENKKTRQQQINLTKYHKADINLTNFKELGIKFIIAIDINYLIHTVYKIEQDYDNVELDLIKLRTKFNTYSMMLIPYTNNTNRISKCITEAHAAYTQLLDDMIAICNLCKKAMNNKQCKNPLQGIIITCKSEENQPLSDELRTMIDSSISDEKENITLQQILSNYIISKKNIFKNLFKEYNTHISAEEQRIAKIYTGNNLLDLDYND